jgi:hypothetical protein
VRVLGSADVILEKSYSFISHLWNDTSCEMDKRKPIRVIFFSKWLKSKSLYFIDIFRQQSDLLVGSSEYIGSRETLHAAYVAFSWLNALFRYDLTHPYC